MTQPTVFSQDLQVEILRDTMAARSADSISDSAIEALYLSYGTSALDEAIRHPFAEVIDSKSVGEALRPHFGHSTVR